MSHNGKMRRGKKWDNFRNRDGILPEDIANDSNKMADVNYFLEQTKPKEVEVKKPKKGV